MGEPSWHSLLKEATDLLRKAGIPHPRNEAILLASFAFSLSREKLILESPTMDTASVMRFRELLHRRAERIPVPYLTGTAGFMDLDLAVTPEVLIPRPATETLVERALHHPAALAADIGTGSGAIAIALARRLPDLQVIATDVSPKALTVAEQNARRYGVEKRIRFMEGALTAPLTEPVDLLCANPPYICTADLAGLEPEISHEPLLALDGGKDGMSCILPLLEKGLPAVRPGGMILMEIGHDQAATVLERARHYGWLSPAVHNDLDGIPRILEARKNSG